MRRSTRILSINTDVYHGGAGKMAIELHRSLSAHKEFESMLVTGRGQGARGIVSLGLGRTCLGINSVGFKITGREGMYNGLIWRKILERYLNWADIVQLHNVHGYYLDENTLNKILQKKVIWMLHDYWILTGRCAYPRKCKGFESGCAPCPHLDRYPSAWVDNASEAFKQKRNILRKCDIEFVAGSDSARATMIAMGLPASSVRTIRYPLFGFSDASRGLSRRLARRQLGIPTDRPVAAFVANEVHRERKGFAILERALRAGVGVDNLLILVVGKTSGNKPLIRKGPGVDVVYTGFLNSRRALYRHLFASDVFVNPSLDETLGMVNLEALACGCMVVASDIPVFRGLDSYPVTYFKMGDSLALTTSLREKLNYPSVHGASRWTSQIKREYSVKAMVSGFIRLYREVVAL